MSRPVSPSPEPSPLETSSACRNIRSARQHNTRVHFVPPTSLAKEKAHNSGKDMDESSLRRQKPALQDTFGLAPHSENVVLTPSSDRSRNRDTSSATTVSSFSAASLRHRMDSVLMKVNFAEAVVQNAAANAKVPMAPEERRKEMVQLEAAKLIVFVGRQFNVREELQQVMGRNLLECNTFTFQSSPTNTDVDFFERETPPNLSIKELRRVAAEMEQQLELEKAKRGTEGQRSPLSADRVTSNLSELLWIIESVELEIPNTQYADLEANVNSDWVPGAQGPRQQLQQKRYSRPMVSSFKTVASSSALDSGKVSSPTGAVDSTTLNEPSHCPSFSSSGSRRSAEEEKKMIAFSVDNESTGCCDAEAAGLRLLQFMYDAISHDQPEDEEDEGTQDTMCYSPSDMLGSARGSAVSRTLGSTMRTTTSAQRYMPMSGNNFGKLDGTMPTDSNEDSEEGSEQDKAAAEQRLSFSTLVETGANTPSLASWMRPASPGTQVYPMREDLIEILQQLYETFNYNYYFQQCRPKKKRAQHKSGEEYAAEIEQRLANQKILKQKHATNQNDRDDEIASAWADKNHRSTSDIGARKKSKKTAQGLAVVEEESLSFVEAETPTTEFPTKDQTPPTEPLEERDETILLTAEVGDSLLFVLKGRLEKRTGSAGTRKKRNSSVRGGKGGKKSAKSKSNASSNEVGNDTDDAAASAEGGALPNFDNYVLYAMNKSDKPVEGLVEIDAKKLQNAKLKALVDYLVQKQTIAVKLAPHGAQAVLTLKPVKKGRRVQFDDALTFREKEPDDKAAEVEAEGRNKSARPSSAHRVHAAHAFTPVLADHASSASASRREEVNRLEKSTASGVETKDVVGTELKEENDAQSTEVGIDMQAPTAQEGDTSIENAVAGSALQALGNTENVQEEESGEDEDYVGSLRGRKRVNAQRKSVKLPFLSRFGREVEGADEEADGDEERGEEGGMAAEAARRGPRAIDVADMDAHSKDSGTLGGAEQRKSTFVDGHSESEGFDQDGNRVDGDGKGGKGRRESRSGRGMSSGGAITRSEEGAAQSDRLEGGESDPSTAGVRPVDQWGIPLQGEDEEAFEKNCVALSVLQASGWHSTSPHQGALTKDGALLSEGGEPMDAGNVDTVVDDILNASGNSLLQYPSGRFRHDRSPEEMAATVFQNIADEERFNMEYHPDDEGLFFSGLSVDSPLRAGSVASWRHQTSSQLQENHHSAESPVMTHLQQKQPSSSAVAGSRTQLGSGSTNHRHETPIPLDGACRSGEEWGENVGVGAASSRPLRSAGHSSASCVTLDAGATGRGTSNVDGRPQSSSVMGVEGGIGVLCESCACTAHLTQGATGAETYDAAMNAVRMSSPVLSRAGMSSAIHKACVSVSGGVRVNLAGALEGESPTRPISGQPPSFLDAMLARITSADKERAPQPMRKEAREYASPTPDSPATPLALHVYTETRPGGRVALLLPENVDAAGAMPAPGAGEAGLTAARAYTETFTEGLRTTLHAYARQATVHSNYMPVDHATNYTKGTGAAKVKSRQSVDAMRYATLPPLSVVYAPAMVQEVEDMEAAEEEARELFLRDPARYDCVVDDLVKRATEKVNEEEEAEKKKKKKRASVGLWKVEGGFSMVSSRLHVRPSVSTRTSTVVPGSSGERSDSGATPERQHRPQQEQEEEQGHLDKAQVAFASELQHHLEEQRRAKKVVAYILMEMRRMWRRREMEANLALRAAVDRFIYHSVLFAWRFERRRVLNLRKLIHLLDRKTGRVSGWVPFYAKDNVLQDRFVWEPAPPHLSRPLRVVHRAMCLARQQRLLPIRIVRQQARKKVASQHLLFGYKRTLVEPSMTTGVRLRHERRCRFAAPFQRPSAKFSPQLEWQDGTPKV